MRIAFFSWETLNSIPVGGVAAVVTQLSEALAAMGHDVHVFTRISGGQPEHEMIRGVHEHRCVSPGCEDFIEYMDHFCDSLVSAFTWAEGKYGKFDVVHAHDWHVVNAIANLRQNLGLQNLVWTCHSTEYGRNGNNFADNWFSGRVRHREWLGGFIANKVTTVSWEMRRELEREYQVPWDKMWVIYNGVNIKKFSGALDAGRVKEKYGIHPFAPVVLFVGRMSYQKGPDLLVEAIPDVVFWHPGAKFIFAGSGDMETHVRGRTWWLGVQDHVRVLGYVSEQDKLNLLKACDMVCVPSRNEPFGIVVLEAFASGKPVVAAEVGGPAEIIDNFRTGIKVRLNPESISWGIKYLLGGSNGGGIRWMGEQAKKEAEKYDWHELAKQYLKVYESVVK